MTPNEAMTPIRKALAVLFDHPELLTLDPAKAHAVQEQIANRQQNPQFADAWQYISTHPTDGSPDPWMTKVPITLPDGKPATSADGQPLAQWRLSDGMRAAILPPLTHALLLVKAGQPDGEQPAPATATAPASASGWTLTSVPSRYGLEIASIAFDVASRRCEVQLRNTYLRHLAVYVELYDGDQAIVPPDWASRLPAAAQRTLETDTTRFLGVLPPSSRVAGMPVPSDPLGFSFPVPQGVTGARLLFGGVGIGSFQVRTSAAAALLTAVMDYALPVILDGAATGLDTSAWYQSQLADEAVLSEVIVAACPLVTNPDATTVQGLLETIAANMGALLLGGSLPTLQASIAKNVGRDAIANAAPVLGWAGTELATQVAQPINAQCSTEALSSPATFSLDLASLVVTLLPDPHRAMWPDNGVSYQITVTYDGTAVGATTGTLPEDGVAPIGLAVPLLPAGGRVDVSASVQSASGQVCGQAQLATTLIAARPGENVAQSLHLIEVPISLSADTRYQRRRTLTYDTTTRKHTWAPSSAAPNPPKGPAPLGLIDITLQEAAGAVGYVWRGGSEASQFAFQNIGVPDAEAGLKFTGNVVPTQPYLIYDRTGSAKAALDGTGPNFYLDPRTDAQDGRHHLRRVSLRGGTPFDLDQSKSWGAFFVPPMGMAVHPAGFVVACSFGTDTVQAVTPPATATVPAQAPEATVILGPGIDIGSVKGPVAVTVTSQGHLLVLEQDNARVQAFDPYGNPVTRFANHSPIMSLRPETKPARYIDLAAGPDDAIYILSYEGNDPATAIYRLDIYLADGTFLSRTPDVIAARLVADAWGRVYTLDYQVFEGPGGRYEPVISQWTPAP